MAIHVFSYNDPGAPPHPNATQGTLATLLRECLVTGYSLGDDVTSPAGWEEMFAPLNGYCAFRSLLGSRQIYQFNEAQPDPDVGYIKGCESLASVDSTPVGQWGEDYFGKRYDATNSAKWYVIADEKTCYVILESYYGNIIHGFGEFDSAIPDDPYNSFLSGHQSSDRLPSSDTSLGLHNASTPGNSRALEVHRTSIGTFAGNAALLQIGGSLSPGSSHTFSGLANTNTGLNFYTVPCFFSCDDGQENGQKLIRGKLRGIYNPLAARPINDTEIITDVATGKDLMCIYFAADNNSSYHGCFFFDITGPW